MMSAFGLIFCFVGSFIFIGLVLLAASIRIVKQGTRLSVYRLGVHIGDKGLGVVFLIPIIDRAVRSTFEVDKE